MAGAPHFREVVFRGEFPLAELSFRGTRFPGRVNLTALNPFIPLNDKDSGIPAAFFEIQVKNPTKEAIRYTIVGVLSNPFMADNVNRIQRSSGLTTLHLTSDGCDAAAPEYGDLALATDAEEVSGQEYWFKGAWFDELEVYWRELMSPGRFKNRRYSPARAGAGTSGLLAVHLPVPPGETGNARFIVSWNIPNCERYWGDTCGLKAEAERKGVAWRWRNHYATLWKNSRASARYALQNWDRLHEETQLFRKTLFASSLPEAALEAVSANLAILKSPTVMRLEDGTLYGWEGACSRDGCCEGSCTHVWNYAQAFPFLFPSLERSMREANYTHNQDSDGGMHFRLQLPLGVGCSTFRPCADGQFGDVMKTYRDWKISGDTDWLRKLWPKIKKSIEYAWNEHNPDRWDPERTGVLQGRQHHTLDMELFGPNAWLTGYYLGALKAASEMAAHLGEQETADEYMSLFTRGKTWADRNLFNGEFYGQRIDLKDRSPAEQFDAMNYWNDEHNELKYQIGEGCEIDQVIAQWHANLYGLGEVFDPKQVKEALRSLYTYNFKAAMREHFNACRLYALNDEGGLVICHWPEHAYRPMTPLPYAGETQNGYEWAACIQMIQAGLIKEGMTCVRAIRSRYDGERRNPWNEFECGSNYARSMATYSLLQAFSGFEFDMVRRTIGFHPIQEEEGRFRCFWSLASGWGEVILRPGQAELCVLYGSLRLKAFRLSLLRSAKAQSARANGEAVAFTQEADALRFSRLLTLRRGESLRVKVKR